MSKKHKNYALKKCDKCGKKTRKVWVKSAKMLCYRCYQIEAKTMYFSLGGQPLTLEKALAKTYMVKPAREKTPKLTYGYCTFPRVLIGYKIKLVNTEKINELKNGRKRERIKKR